MSYVTKFNMTRDVGGQNGFGLIPSNTKYGVLLAAGVPQSVVSPSDSPSHIEIFSYTPGSNVFVDFSTTAAAFTGTIGPVTAELNPSARLLPKGTTVSILTPDAAGAYVGIVFYIAGEYTN